jgi:probable rRNA maturation factor
MEAQIQNRQRGIKVDLEPLRRLLQRISVHLGIEDKELSVVLVNDKRIAPLNQRYRKRAGPTDVLAFAMQEGEFTEINPRILGDVVISVETAQQQAQAQQHSLTRELQILMIHGVLHLLGYDHIQQADAERMHRQELKLLKYIT